MKTAMAKKSFIIAVATLFSAILLLHSCGVDKFIPQGEYLLTKNSVEIDYSALDEADAKGVSQAISGVKSYIRQSPNSKLVLFPIAMRIYCLSSPTDSNWINRVIRKQGEAPVIYSQELAERSARQMELLLESKGCFGSQVVYDTHIVKNNRVSVTYKIKPKPRYVIGEVGTVCGNAGVKALMDELTGQSDVKTGNYYDQMELSGLRDRVATRLQNRGYYTATKESISFLIDTNIGGRKMNVSMLIRENSNAIGDTTPKPTLVRYYIDNVYIYPDLENLMPVDSLHNDTLPVEARVMNNDVVYNFVTNKKMRIRPETICQTLLLYPSQMYRNYAVERSYMGLWGLRNFKFVDMDFVPSSRTSDTAGYLDLRIRLMNAMRRSMSLSLELNNTSPINTQNTSNTGNFGLELGLGYQNKNVFGGAEIFNMKTSLAVELSKLAINNNKVDFYELFSTFESGLDMSLDIPKFIVPFASLLSSHNVRPHTLFNLGANYQYRAYFERLIGNTSFGYTWQHRRTTKHQFLPVEFTLVKFINQNESFRRQIENLNDLRLKYQYSDHLIFDMRYNFVYSTQQLNTKTNFSYLSLGVETAGNLLSAIYNLSDLNADSSGIYHIFDIPFSQYVRLDFDWKRYFYLSSRNTFVFRITGGIGIPYGNSISMPYEKSFYGGGPTTIRSWHIRTLGPGGYINNSSTNFERVGDISLTFNVEERFKIFGIFEGAAFVDAGNVWLLHRSEEFPEGEFRFDKFYKQIAMGAGLGLRANISILTLRLDFAIPLFNPGASDGNQWMFSKLKFNQIVTNFGIDYPF